MLDLDKTVRIPNHASAKLSELDLRIAVCVPPGGNWKDIPESIPSKRIKGIRESYAAGGGSRSTYYGRLHPERPAYTINTYYNRPGNGCHLHYDFEGDQHRVLSAREAARLQSFPDDFVFLGPQTAIQKQIGNAVPPLLSLQVFRTLGIAGDYVDLFCGAGGLSLGAKWAGWNSIIANDSDANAVATYKRNIKEAALVGDIRNDDVFQRIIETAKLKRDSKKPLFVVGGPPCQGFSTAGNRRSTSDERNLLFYEFRDLIREIRPQGFIFENVMGLLSMEGGAVFEHIKSELSIVGNRLYSWILKTEEYGIPQKRTRLMLISVPAEWPEIQPPQRLTSANPLFLTKPIGSREALDDLPSLSEGEDGSRSKLYIGNHRESQCCGSKHDLLDYRSRESMRSEPAADNDALHSKILMDKCNRPNR